MSYAETNLLESQTEIVRVTILRSIARLRTGRIVFGGTGEDFREAVRKSWPSTVTFHREGSVIVATGRTIVTPPDSHVWKIEAITAV